MASQISEKRQRAAHVSWQTTIVVVGSQTKHVFNHYKLIIDSVGLILKQVDGLFSLSILWQETCELDFCFY